MPIWVVGVDAWVVRHDKQIKDGHLKTMSSQSLGISGMQVPIRGGHSVLQNQSVQFLNSNRNSVGSLGNRDESVLYKVCYQAILVSIFSI
jgi:hypothetical protein